MYFSLFNLLFCSFKVPDGGFPHKSRTIGFIDSDHILFAKHQALLNSFRFVTVMGWQMILMFVCSILIISIQLTLRDCFENYKVKLNSRASQRRRHNYYYFFARNFQRNLIAEKRPNHNYYYCFASNLWQTMMAIFGQISNKFIWKAQEYLTFIVGFCYFRSD